jgi:hypothetical protein
MTPVNALARSLAEDPGGCSMRFQPSHLQRTRRALILLHHIIKIGCMSTLQFSLVAHFTSFPQLKLGAVILLASPIPPMRGSTALTASTAPLLPLTTKLTRSRHSPDCSGYPCRGAQDSSVKQVAGDWQIPGSLLQIMVSTI